MRVSVAAAALAAALVVIVSGLCVFFLAPANSSSAADLELLRAELAELRRDVRTLQQRQDDVSHSLTKLLERDGQRTSMPARWLESQPSSSVDEPDDERTLALMETASQEAVPAEVSAQALADLLDPSTSAEERRALWAQLREDGLVDEFIGFLEEASAANPVDPKLKMELGKAYIEKIQAGVSGDEADDLAHKADRAFDQALSLDPRNWEARFTKARALTYWPDTYGRRPEAIEHFERLVDQQAGLPSRAEFAETHLFLGNLYRRSGDLDKAISAWRHGLARFPNDGNLKRQLDQAMAATRTRDDRP